MKLDLSGTAERESVNFDNSSSKKPSVDDYKKALTTKSESLIM